MISSQALPDTLTTRETAKLLSASVRTIQLWVEDGRLKAWKTPGGHRRVLRTSVEEMLANRRRTSGDGRRKYEVLVAHADPDQIFQLEQVLSNLAQDVHMRHTTDGYEALIRLGETRVDLLVIDLDLPGLDGVQLLRALCRVSSRQPAGIIALSALSPDEVRSRGGVPDGVILLHMPLRTAALLSFAKSCHADWREGGR